MDPLAALLTLLRPRTVLSKLVEGAGRWGVRYPPVETAGFGLVLEGRCYLNVVGEDPVQLQPGDFVLMPATPGFAMVSHLDCEPQPATPNGATWIRHGEGEPDFRLLGGYFQFDPTNLELLRGLLPSMLHLHAEAFPPLVELIAAEAASQRPGRDLVLERLVEVLLVKALRLACPGSPPGLLRGLADPALASALRAMHADVAHPWSVAAMAEVAGLSRSAFSERFRATVGLAPSSYLNEWRMALARDLLRRERPPLEHVAEAVGYQSASAFSTAFRRHTGQSPSHFTREGGKSPGSGEGNEP